MTYAELAGSLASGSVRLGAETTVWCPLLAAAALVLFVVAAVLLSSEDSSPTDADPA